MQLEAANNKIANKCKEICWNVLHLHFFLRFASDNILIKSIKLYSIAAHIG